MTSLLEDGLIKTGSIEQVMAPLSTHLCQLILLCGSDSELDQFTQLEAAATSVSKASKNMAAMATRSVTFITFLAGRKVRQTNFTTHIKIL